MATFYQLPHSISSICGGLFSLLPLIFFIVWMIKLFVKKNENRSKPPPPEAGGAWPIIGHLYLFGGNLLPHKLLGELANKYGPIFSMRIGVQKALVVSSWEMARECLLLNDKSVTSRPRLLVFDIMGYGNANFVNNPYGPYWCSLRKIITLELLSNHRIDMLSHVWKEQVNVCINNLYEIWLKNKKRTSSDVVLVDLKPWLSQLSMSIIVRIICGKGYVNCGEELLNLRKTIEDFFYRMGSFSIGDSLPFLRWMDLGGQEKAMKKTAKEMDGILERWMFEHKERRLGGSREGDKDFIDVMLSALDDSHVINDSGFDADTITKATCLMMLSGASDTSSVFLTWTISLLLNNRNVLKKAQHELDVHVGKDRWVSESDIPKLVYLQAIAKETLRMYPPAPLSGPREFNEDCTIGGYHVKKGTRLIVNLSKIHCDPRVWEDPMEFRPERFLTTHKDVDAFEFSTVDDVVVDMTESFGLTNLKATSLDVLIAPRLPFDMYKYP